MTEERINILNDVGFVWQAQRGGSIRKKKLEKRAKLKLKELLLENSTNSIPKLNKIRNTGSHAATIDNTLASDEGYASNYVFARKERTTQQTYHRIDSRVHLEPYDVTFRAVRSPRKKIKAATVIPAMSTERVDTMIPVTDDRNHYSTNYGKISCQPEYNDSNTMKTHRIDDSIFADAAGDEDPAVLMLKGKFMDDESSARAVEGVTPHDEAAKTLIDFVSQLPLC